MFSLPSPIWTKDKSPLHMWLIEVVIDCIAVFSVQQLQHMDWTLQCPEIVQHEIVQETRVQPAAPSATLPIHLTLVPLRSAYCRPPSSARVNFEVVHLQTSNGGKLSPSKEAEMKDMSLPSCCFTTISAELDRQMWPHDRVTGTETTPYISMGAVCTVAVYNCIKVYLHNCITVSVFKWAKRTL